MSASDKDCSASGAGRDRKHGARDAAGNDEAADGSDRIGEDGGGEIVVGIILKRVVEAAAGTGVSEYEVLLQISRRVPSP